MLLTNNVKRIFENDIVVFEFSNISVENPLDT